MSVVCDVCGTQNRDNAMFCLGCAGRLAAFAPSGASVLEAIEARRLPDAGPAPQVTRGRAALPAESSGLWIRLSLVMLAMGIAFIAWYVHVTRKVTLPVATAPVALIAPPVATPAPASRADEAVSLAPVESVPVTPSEPVRPVRAPAPVEDAAGPPVAPGPGPVADAEPAQRPKKQPGTRVTKKAWDPVRACADLDYLSMARCQSAQCQAAEYRWHPRCQAVREEQQQIDEARRRLAQGY